MFKYCLPLLLLIYPGANNVLAQGRWMPKGTLYHDKFITVEIQYKINEYACGPNGELSQFRYKIIKTGKIKEYYINWYLGYFNCRNELVTQLNQLHINSATTLIDDHLDVPNSDFPAKKIANYFDNVQVAHAPINVTDYKIPYPYSLEPVEISGKLTISSGDSTRLAIVGGYLAENDAWKWYEGECGKNFIGAGTSIIVKPVQHATYYVRAEGEETTPCISVSIDVKRSSIAATAVEGPDQICLGEKNVRLRVSGGQLGDGAKWVWYQDNCGGASVGEGEAIYPSPSRSTTFFVRAEGPDGHSDCQSHRLIVLADPVKPSGINGPSRVEAGGTATLTVSGGTLADGGNWVWYTGDPNNKQKIGTGGSITIGSLSATQTFYARAEGGVCGATSGFVEKVVEIASQVVPPPIVKHHDQQQTPFSIFVNGGLVANNLDKITPASNYSLTVGGGRNIGFYLRAKLSTNAADASFTTDNYQVANYHMPGYYSYNGKILNERTAYTGGLYLGSRTIAIYLGGGYGTRELLWGINEYTYAGPLASGSAWAKNTSLSYTGAEAEGGLLLRLGPVNIMGGINTIQFNYIDYNLGLGLNF